MSATTSTTLVRAMGRWTLAALVINVVIASGIFRLPQEIAQYLGQRAPWAYLIAAAGIGIIMACFAEVASQFGEAGGPYLYTREAFGQFAGIQMGWLALVVRITSAAANANVFVIYLGHFWPAATQPVPRAAILTLLLGVLVAVNYVGVNAGANLSTLITAAKLVALLAFVVLGFAFLRGPLPADAPVGSGQWLPAILALIFAYGGFEAGLMAMGEAKDPRRDAPFALFAALIAATVVYTLVHMVVMRALVDPGAAERPLAAAAQVFLGGAGAALISLAAMLSTYGQLSGQMVVTPRLSFAFAERGDFPPFFGAIHSKYRTPYVSIVLFGILVLVLAIYGSFIWNAILSAVVRLFTYGFVCASLIVFRKRNPQADAFRLPAGPAFAVAGVAFCLVLITQMDSRHVIFVAVTAAIALLNWMWARPKKRNGQG